MKIEWRRNCTQKFESVLDFYRKIFLCNNEAYSSYYSVSLYSSACSNSAYSSTSDILSIIYTTQRNSNLACKFSILYQPHCVSASCLFCVYYILYCVRIILYVYTFCVLLLYYVFLKYFFEYEV